MTMRELTGSEKRDARAWRAGYQYCYQLTLTMSDRTLLDIVRKHQSHDAIMKELIAKEQEIELARDAALLVTRA